MSLAILFLSFKISLILGFYCINFILCDLKKYEVIIIPNSNSRVPKHNRLLTSRLDIKEYDIATELPDIDNFDYSHNSNEEEKVYYDYRKDKTTTIKHLIGHFDDDDPDYFKLNTLHNLRKNCAALKKLEHMQRTGLKHNNFNVLPPNESAMEIKHRVHSPVLDLSKEDYSNDYNENTSDEYKDAGGNRIVGGVNVDINIYPYHIGYGTNCGAAIIDRKWAITAGHCGVKNYIRAGSKYLHQGTKYAVKNNYVHPMWSAIAKEHEFDYDFQLLELEEPLKLGPNIQPVKLGREKDMVIGKVVTVTGWGNIHERGTFSKTLRAVRVPIISKANCQLVPYPYFMGKLTPRMFCAGYKEGKKDACQGDSGGPAVANNRLLGMVSFGYGCATPGAYGVYSKIVKVKNWIKETTGLNFD